MWATWEKSWSSRCTGPVALRSNAQTRANGFYSMGAQGLGSSGRLEFIRLCCMKSQTTEISGAASVKAERTCFQFGVKFALCLSPSCLEEKGEGTLLVPRFALFGGLPTLCTLWVFYGSSLGAHWGGAKFCSAVHIQGSMLMRIIIKRCRVGTRLLQSALRQKQEGQRQS